MSNNFLGLIIGVAGGIWIYLQASRRMGSSSPKQAGTIAVIVAIVLFILVVTVLGKLFPN